MGVTLRRMGIAEGRVLAAIAAVDRAVFVPEERKAEAYEDYPLPIGFGQTISQPYTIARMLELLIQNSKFEIRNLKILEIGTGSGWQTSLLSKLFGKVFSVETFSDLARKAEFEIRNLKFENVRIKVGDGKKGWKEYAPYDGIICGANAQEIPAAWMKQLKTGGRIVCPVKGVMTRGIKINSKFKYQKSNQTQNINDQDVFLEEFGKYDFVPLV